MRNNKTDNSPIFGRRANYLGLALVILVIGGVLWIPVVVGIGGTPRTTDVGYMPVQPVPYSHAVHVGQLGMDCRYCHTTVEQAAFAAVPPTQTCMNCHKAIKPDSPQMVNALKSYSTDTPIEWVKVHDLPNYAYFNHSAHVNKGVGCVSCHGRVDKMERVYQAHTLSMSWCLACHRAPERHLRPVDRVTQMDWTPNQDQIELGLRLKKEYNIRDSKYLTNCSICHR